MTFAFTGFFQDGGFRVFSFETLPRDHGTSPYWVRADMNLIRQHHIPMQDLPLLCRAVLENRAGVEAHTLTYTANEMKLHAEERETSGQRKYRKVFPRRVKAEA